MKIYPLIPVRSKLHSGEIVFIRASDFDASVYSHADEPVIVETGEIFDAAGLSDDEKVQAGIDAEKTVSEIAAETGLTPQKVGVIRKRLLNGN